MDDNESWVGYVSSCRVFAWEKWPELKIVMLGEHHEPSCGCTCNVSGVTRRVSLPPSTIESGEEKVEKKKKTSVSVVEWATRQFKRGDRALLELDATLLQGGRQPRTSQIMRFDVAFRERTGASESEIHHVDVRTAVLAALVRDAHLSQSSALLTRFANRFLLLLYEPTLSSGQRSEWKQLLHHGNINWEWTTDEFAFTLSRLLHIDPKSKLGVLLPSFFRRLPSMKRLHEEANREVIQSNVGALVDIMVLRSLTSWFTHSLYNEPSYEKKKGRRRRRDSPIWWIYVGNWHATRLTLLFTELLHLPLVYKNEDIHHQCLHLLSIRPLVSASDHVTARGGWIDRASKHGFKGKGTTRLPNRRSRKRVSSSSSSFSSSFFLGREGEK